MSQRQSETLSKGFELGFTYTRSTGPVVGRFFAGLRDGKVFGVRGSDGKVYVPPPEYDPHTAAALSDFVAVGQAGTVQSFSWVGEPRRHHLFDKPFAFALITLDGADVPMLHMVDAGSAGAMEAGMKVRIRWAEQRTGNITDIACFEPV